MKLNKVLRKIRENYRDFYWWRDNIIYYTLRMFERNNGDYILDEDWDNLIILDDCRYDIFKIIYLERKMIRKLQKRISRGTYTVDFLVENFSRCDRYNDIVYITANPYVDIYLNRKFYKIISVWKTGWNEKYKTVLPSTVMYAAINALKKYPRKRFIIHFLQPHHPYLSLDFEDLLMEKIRDAATGKIQNIKEERAKSLLAIYSSSLYASVPIDCIVEAYINNLRIVMPYVELLLSELPGRTIVTSDHGESFGDKINPLLPIKFYGHGFTRLRSLISVPWLVVDEEFKAFYRRGERKRKNKREIAEVEKKLCSERQRIRELIKLLRLGERI